MLARGIRSYHRPGRIEDAMKLAAQGVPPLAGGTRLLALPGELPNVLDLTSLDLVSMQPHDGDLEIGAMTTLQALADSPMADEASAGLLPEACRAHSASRMIRGTATLGGEAVFGAPDSDVVAALLALNAVFVIAHGDGPIESPALRFLRKPSDDLKGGGIVRAILIPSGIGGTALERVAVLPSAPTLVSAAVSLSFAGPRCVRARIALTGLAGRPARVLPAEARYEGTTGDAKAVERVLEEIVKNARFRDDAHAPASYRQAVAPVLVRRALTRAFAQAHGEKRLALRRRPVRARGTPMPGLEYFTSGRVELECNGRTLGGNVDARTSLLDLLRREGVHGVKHGCESGECGACTVLLDGNPTLSCITLALRAQGRNIQSVESLGTPDMLEPLQHAFVDNGAVQCGYCTPAMLLCAKALLDAIPDPSEAEVRDALAGALCRCTGYVKPVQAVLRVSRTR